MINKISTKISSAVERCLVFKEEKSVLSVQSVGDLIVSVLSELSVFKEEEPSVVEEKSVLSVRSVGEFNMSRTVDSPSEFLTSSADDLFSHGSHRFHG